MSCSPAFRRHRLAPIRPLDRRDELVGRRILQDETVRPQGDRPGDVRRVLEGGHHHDLHVGRLLPQLLQRVQSVDAGHHDIHQQHIRLLPDRAGQRFRAGGRFGDDVDVLVLHHALDTTANDFLIVRHYHLNAHAMLLLRGSQRLQRSLICRSPGTAASRFGVPVSYETGPETTGLWVAKSNSRALRLIPKVGLVPPLTEIRSPTLYSKPRTTSGGCFFSTKPGIVDRGQPVT